MKKKSLSLRAVIGIQMGLLLLSAQHPEGMSPEMRTFYEQLDPSAKRKFDELDPEHKKRAMNIVETYCKAAQECKGHREKSVDQQYKHQMQQQRQNFSN